MLGKEVYEKVDDSCCKSLVIGIRKAGNVMIFDLKGNLTNDGSALCFRRTVNMQLAEKNFTYLLFNLKEVTSIDPSGTGELTSTLTRCKKQARDCKLLSLNFEVVDINSATKLLTVFDSYDDESMALCSFG